MGAGPRTPGSAIGSMASTDGARPQQGGFPPTTCEFIGNRDFPLFEPFDSSSGTILLEEAAARYGARGSLRCPQEGPPSDHPTTDSIRPRQEGTLMRLAPGARIVAFFRCTK